MSPTGTERHPLGYAWHERFTNAVRVLRSDGGAVYAAETGRDCWLIRDEGALGNSLPYSDRGAPITITRYRDREEFARDVDRLRQARPLEPANEPPDPDASVVVAITHATALALEEVAAKRGLSGVNERDHLQPECAKVARALAPASSLSASTQRTIAFRAWPRLGNVDIALNRSGEPPILVELKCKSGRDALGECVWDAAKLAFAMQCGHGVGFLLAGAPEADWDKPVRGAELFSDAEHDITLCRVLYADWWRHWERQRDPQPTELPSAFATQHLHTAPFAVGGSAWQLRLAGVQVRNEQRLQWPRLTEPQP